MKVTALGRAGSPAVHSPGRVNPGGLGGAVVAQVSPSLGSVFPVGVPSLQPDDLVGGAAQGNRGLRELALIKVVHRDRHTKDVDGLDSRGPREMRVGEKPIIVLEHHEVVAVGVAVAHRVLPRGIGGIDRSVGLRFLTLPDVIVKGIDHLSGIDAAGVIPRQAVVEGAVLNTGGESVVTSAQENSLLFEKGSNLSLEGEAGGGCFAEELREALRDRGIGHQRDGLGVEEDHRIGRIGKRLIPDNLVEVGEIPGGQKQGIIGGPVVDRGCPVDAEGFPAVENGLVDLDQSDLIHIVEGQGHVPLPPGACLGEEADIGVDGVIEEIAEPLTEGVDPGKDPLDPPFHQGWLGPLGPVAVLRSVAEESGVRGLPFFRGEGPIAHGDVVVAEGQERLRPAPEDIAVLSGGRGSKREPVRRAGVARQFRRRAVDRRGIAPFEFIVGGHPGEVASVLEGDLLAERVGRYNGFDLSLVKSSTDLENLHGDGLSLEFGIRTVPEDHGDVTAPASHCREGIGGHRGVGVDDLCQPGPQNGPVEGGICFVGSRGVRGVGPIGRLRRGGIWCAGGGHHINRTGRDN